jgi:hypothetical protein
MKRYFFSFATTDFRRNSLKVIAVLAFGMIGLRSALAANTTKFTWPGELDGPKSLWVSQAPLLLIGLAGSEADLVGIAADEAPTTTTTSPQNDNSSHASSQQVGNSTITMSFSSHSGHVTVDTEVVAHDSYNDVTAGKTLGSQESTAILHFEVSPCPEVDGVAGGRISVQLRQETTYPDGSRSSSTALAEGPFRVVNGDDAYRVRTDMDLQITGGSLHTAPSADPSDPAAWALSGPLNISLGTNGPAKVSVGDEANLSWAGEFPNDGLAQSPAQDVVLKTMLFVEKAVEKFWRSGKCIKLKLNEQSRKVDPQEKISLTVEAEHRIDHKEVKTPIKAQLTGVKSNDPNDKAVDEPAKFDYVAGGKRGDQGFIEVTQTGKRGIGKESLTFTVEARDLLFSLTETIRRPGNNGDRLLLFSLPPTSLVLQEDGTYRGTGPLAIKLDFHEWRTHAVGNGVNQLTIQARPSESDPKRFYVTTSLVATPFTVTQTHTNLSIGTLTYPHLEDAGSWSDTFSLELDKVDRFQGGPGTIERLLREDPEKR